MAMVAEEEGRQISIRTKAALQAAKARGTKLGGRRPRKSDGQLVTIDADMRALGIAARQQRSADRATDIAPTIKALQAAGATSLRAIAAGGDTARSPPPKGHGGWASVEVAGALERICSPAGEGAQIAAA